MKAAFRSVFVVNRGSLMGTAVIVALAAALLTATGTWLEAGVRDEKLSLIVGLASSFAGVVVIIAIFIVSSIFSGALRLRRREFALLRAIGATASQVRTTVTTEALAILLIAAPVGIAVGILVAPLLVPLLQSSVELPDGFALPFSLSSIGATLLVLVPTALVAAAMAAGGILRVSPTVAVRDSTIDAPASSQVRLLIAAGLAVAGLIAAATPFFIPGMIGSASAAMSAILLVVAAALAGPALVHRVAVRGMKAVGSSQGPARVLAFANARGFSRRLSAAVIPLALLIALGSVQSGTTASLVQATNNELRAGVQADLVVQSTVGVTAEQATAISALPGVTAALSSGHLTAGVRTDPPDEDLPALDGLNWETETMNTFTTGDETADTTTLLDPKVVSGSLNDLRAPNTIAVGQSALLFTGKGIGDTVDIRLTGENATQAKIVAIYERDLGFGAYILGAPETGADTQAFDAVFVDATAESMPAVRTAIEEMGLTITDAEGYASAATKGSGGQQQLSLVLLIALLGFVAAAAANTLAMSTSSRRDEFELLKRIGATRAQIMKMAAIETVFIIVTAVVIGVLSVLPALLGVAQGMLGIPLPVFDVPVTLTLIGATALIAALTVIPTALRATLPAR